MGEKIAKIKTHNLVNIIWLEPDDPISEPERCPWCGDVLYRESYPPNENEIWYYFYNCYICNISFRLAKEDLEEDV